MTRPLRGAAGPIAAVALLAALTATAAAQPPPPPPAGAAPAWVARRTAWIDAREARRLARWNEPLERLAAADLRAASAESLYRATLLAWTPDASALRAPLGDLRGAALDLLSWGESERASLLLEGALRDDEPLLPIRAAARGRNGKAAEGLSLLAWPPDRRLARGDRWEAGFSAPARGAARDLAHLLTAAELAESLGDIRSARAAYWAVLASPDGGPAGRNEATRLLGRRLVADGTPRLAISVIGDPVSSDEALALGSAFLAIADTSGAVEALVRFGTRSGTALSERYPSLRRAADLARPRADSLGERTHLDLCRTLGEVGEAERGLSLIAARSRAPSDSAAALARLETEAGLLARARRYPDAMAAYARTAARPGLAAPVRARIALGYARAARGARIFAAMDSAFQAAVALDSTGAVGEQAAWERAREWEDQREAAEAGAVFEWASPYLRGPSLRSAGRVHGALAEKRAGSLDSARATLARAGSDDAVTSFWRGALAAAAGDSAASRAGYRSAAKAAPGSYEGVRALEELRAQGLAPATDAGANGAADRRVARDVEEGASAPTEVRVLAALGRDAIAIDRLKRCARESGPAAAVTCTDVLEEAGTFRVGPRALLPEGRLDFPPAYPREVLRAAAAESVSAALLWAIMRQESAYDRRARSKAGALGLLQLMPATASQLAGRAVPEDSLTDAGLNVRLGARYVRALLREFGDARAVLASYNAGEDAVRRWKRDGAPIDDEWVERIPYRETRDYVKVVYAAWRRYEALYGPATAPPPAKPAF
ncbi:MAG TPA: lytic transglycosylase domain-containing protein [Candidatus Eisenbacteria bacterium]|nr:lytic transglycosylase domain-containing protein [Candidatus Eisenbacteria bacterium]